MNFYNHFVASTLDKSVEANNNILNSALDIIYSGDRFTDYIAFGAGFSQTDPDLEGLVSPIGMKKASVVSCNYDVEKGECFVACEIVLLASEFIGAEICEVGFCAGAGKRIINRAVFETPIKKEAGKTLTISGVFALEVWSDIGALTRGENRLVRALLGQDEGFRTAEFGLAKDNNNIVGTILVDSATYEPFATTPVLSGDQITFTANLGLDRFDDLMLTMDGVSVARVNNYSALESFANVSGMWPQSQMWKHTYEAVRYIGAIMVSIMSQDISSLKNYLYPSKVIEYDLPFMRLDDKAEIVYSPEGEFVLLSSPLDIVVLEFGESFVRRINTAAIPTNAIKYQICTKGEVVILGEDGRTFRVFVVKNNAYQEVLFDFVSEKSIDDFCASSNKYDKVTIGAAYFNSESAEFFELGLNEESGQFEVVNQNFADKLYGLKGIKAYGHGNSVCEYNNFTIYSPTGASLINGSNNGYSPSDRLTTNGFFIGIKKSGTFNVDLLNYNLSEVLAMGVDSEGAREIAPNAVLDKQQNKITYIPSTFGSGYELSFEKPFPAYKKMILNRQFLVFIMEGGACKVWLLDDKELYGKWPDAATNRNYTQAIYYKRYNKLGSTKSIEATLKLIKEA